MDRRRFLSVLGAAAAAPAVPFVAGGAPARAVTAAGYNRYMYGLAVFHARSRAHVTAADLMARLRLTGVQADAMMAEMASSGVLSPVSGTVKMATHQSKPGKPYIRKAMRHLQELLEPEKPRTDDAAPRRCKGGVRTVHASHPPASDKRPPTSGGSNPGES